MSAMRQEMTACHHCGVSMPAAWGDLCMHCENELDLMNALELHEQLMAMGRAARIRRMNELVRIQLNELVWESL